jgi:hemerythrin-like domain-containing protein
MATVIETLREDHRNTGRLLAALEHQIEVFAQAGAPDYDVIVGIAEYFLEYPDRCHHPKENVIFDQLKSKYPQEASTVGNLLGEHRSLHEQTLQFRQTVSALLNDTDIPRDAVVNVARLFIETERRHMQKEEEHFLPLAEQVLTKADWSHIEGALAYVRDPLFGGLVEQRFSRVRERLLAWEREYRIDQDP